MKSSTKIFCKILINSIRDGLSDGLKGVVDALVELLRVDGGQFVLAAVSAVFVDGGVVQAVDPSVAVTVLLVLPHVALDGPRGTEGLVNTVRVSWESH